MSEADERSAFYQAIMDNWNDDTPRLVFADWLDERGDELSRLRAELIRLQCELARYQREKETPPDGMNERDRKLQQVIRDYFAQRGFTLEDNHGEADFERGFVESWGYVFDAKLLNAGDEEGWALLGPVVIDGVSLGRDQNERTPSSECVQLVSSPGVNYWVSYRNGDEKTIGEANCIALFKKGRFVNLRRITITEQARGQGWDGEELVTIGNGGLKAIAENPALAKLTHLKLWWAGFSDDGLKALAEANHLRSIRKLSLADEFTDTGVVALAASPVLETVERLHLNGHLTGRSLQHLMASPRLKSLHTLDLSVWTSGTHEHDHLDRLDWSLVFDDLGVEAFVNSPLLPQLKVLKLSDCGISPEGAQKLAQAAPRMTSLKRLSSIGLYCELLEQACRKCRGHNVRIEREYFDQKD
ncbi:TIGR02996 domain-containing protein [Gemmata sp. G18]|uniref:TIGR02996 domain-containing protein n=1 Tax=Gemmata palustris TaxID=2822762 RepID=A0ABS5BSD6_9BACT|nr:TIGR02996 domain-containing protein [Gemmata palustris]MBP3956649.1 TIGR02996 domain-containing protein [Gemmata palustris]